MKIAGIEAGGDAKLNAQQQKNATNAQSGLKAIDRLEQEITKNPNALGQAWLPGSPGARILKTARGEAADVLTRLRTGAALNEEEQRFYQGQLPQLFDSPETIQYKLELFRDLFNEISSGQRGSPEVPQLQNLQQEF